MYLSGVALDIIQRFGRWISPCFLVYLHYDNIALRHIGNMFKEGHGVLDQQRVAYPLKFPGQRTDGGDGNTGVTPRHHIRRLSLSMDSLQLEVMKRALLTFLHLGRTVT